MSIKDEFDRVVELEMEELRFVLNEEETSTLLRLGLDIEGRIEKYLEESGVLDKLTSLGNGESGSLEENPNWMDFGSLDGISVVRGIWEVSSGKISC